MLLNKIKFHNLRSIASLTFNPFYKMSTEVSQKLIDLRNLMNQNSVDAYVVTHNNAHLSEYIPDCEERLRFISGFSGSSGLAVVTHDQALMWTDSRYYIQATKELEKGWTMMKLAPGELRWDQWVAQSLKEKAQVGYNPLLLSAQRCKMINKEFEPKQMTLKSITEDLVEKLWKDRPSVPKNPIFIHDITFAGKESKDKIKEIGEEVKKQGAQTYIITSLEEIAWTLNLRGNGDCKITPYFVAFLILNFNFENGINWDGTLYIYKEKVTQEVANYLKDLNLNIKEYDEVTQDIPNIKSTIFIDVENCNASFYNLIAEKDKIKSATPSIIERLKAVKNQREIQGFSECHIRDGAAIVRYLAWLDHALNAEKRTDIDEYNAWLKLEEIRSQQKWNKGFSFEGISSIGANGAIVHYRPEPGKAAIINNKEMYLLDNGGQYLDGTTDTTRTTHFGNPTLEEIDCYTRVLLGNLDVEMVKFPKGKRYSGADIDVLARRYLWEAGLDFGHGTGHGVGYFLNVHEGPHGISKYRAEPFVEGMVVTDEPGYYKEGAFGIRIENILIVEAQGDGNFLGFKNVTCVPYERKLINLKLCNSKHIEHINAYHEKVYQNLEPLLIEQKDEIALNWLKEKTAKLQA